jgi:hypothetical protein
MVWHALTYSKLGEYAPHSKHHLNRAGREAHLVQSVIPSGHDMHSTEQTCNRGTCWQLAHHMHVLLCLAWLQVAPSATNQICWTHPWVPATSILYYTCSYLKWCSIYCSVTLRYDILSPVQWLPTYQRTTISSKYGKQLTVTNFTSENTWNLLTYSSLPLLLFSVLSSSLYGLPLFFPHSVPFQFMHLLVISTSRAAFTLSNLQAPDLLSPFHVHYTSLTLLASVILSGYLAPPTPFPIKKTAL